MMHSRQGDGWMAHLMALATLSAAPDQFWAHFADLAQQATGASRAEVFSRDVGTEAAAWQAVTAGAQNLEQRVSPVLLHSMRAEGLAAMVGAGENLALAQLPTSHPSREVVLLLTYPPQVRPETGLSRLAALATVPLLYERGRESRLAGRDAQRLAQGLGLLGNLLDTEGFNPAATALVNRLAEMFAAEQVYLTWRKLGGQRLAAVSHGDLPDQRSVQSAQIEEVVQDALTARGEVLYPTRAGDRLSLAAQHFAESARPGHLIALPMADVDAAGRPRELGGLVLTRRVAPFTEAEQWALRLFVEMATRLMLDRADSRRLLPLRLGREIGRSLPNVLRVKTGAGRGLIVALVLAVTGGLLVPVPYSISATAVLETDSTAIVGAPFNGYIKESALQLGQMVKAGDALVTLATDELALERETRLAELAQANRDAEISRSLGKLPEMQVARARADESKAQLLLLDARIAAARVIAPMDGVVVEGEPAKRLGQAVNRGDKLVTLAQTSGLHVQAAVPERDLNLLQTGAQARLTLLAKPEMVYDLRVDRTIPAARAQDGGNVFPVRMTGDKAAPDWWLPGMTGVVRIEAGHRPIIWSALRRIVDYARLNLWL